MAEKIPLIKPGEIIRASYINQIVDAVNEELIAAPRDLERARDPVPREERLTSYSSRRPNILAEVRRSSEEVRIYQNEDTTSENYVDVDRATVSLMFNPRNGEAWIMYWLNE